MVWMCLSSIISGIDPNAARGFHELLCYKMGFCDSYWGRMYIASSIATGWRKIVFIWILRWSVFVRLSLLWVTLACCKTHKNVVRGSSPCALNCRWPLFRAVTSFGPFAEERLGLVRYWWHKKLRFEYSSFITSKCDQKYNQSNAVFVL